MGGGFRSGTSGGIDSRIFRSETLSLRERQYVEAARVLGAPWPWIRGLDLLKRIRHLGVKAPIFMMTGVWNTEKEAEAMIEGAAGYLHKPFDLRELHTDDAARAPGDAAGGQEL